ncbi:MAG TPA: Ig-like domain-containing protein, partial [Gammaproteobacteria bacterium]|nr:Ig-like domain-containing protein [Gammaproteobacteria bacterium]
ANDLNFSLYSGQAFTSVLSAVDVNGNPMTYAISTQPTHGTLSVTATSGAFVYTPSAGYTGGDSFAYTATDNVSNLASSAATASLTITAAPPPPPAPVHHGGPGIGAYGAGNLLLLLLLTAWRGLRRLLPALGAAALFWTASAGADDAQPANPPADPWYAGAQINVIKPDSSRDASTHGLRGWGLFFGKDIGDYALEFNGAYHADDPRSINGLANWKTYGLDGLWFFTHRASPTFSPFADTGLGFADQYHGDDSTLSKLYLALGIGFNSAPWQSVPVTLRTDLQLQHVLGSYNDLVLRFGLAFSFGGTQPAPAPTPLPDASPLDKYPMAWCTQEGGQPQQTDSGWVCYLPGGRTESRPNSAAPPPATVAEPPAATAAPPPVAVPTNPR